MLFGRLLTFMISFLVFLPAMAAGPSFDVVFDLDWTLFYPAKRPFAQESIQIGEDYYRMADGVPQVIAALYRDGHRVSIFSGGDLARNTVLAEYIAKRVQDLGVPEFAFHKILSLRDLTHRPGSTDQDRFRDRFMKDVSKVNPDLNRVVIVDDISGFAVRGQEKNMFWLGTTYSFHVSYDSSLTGLHDPPNEAEWRRERKKIVSFHKLFKAALSGGSEEDVLGRLQGLREGRMLCSKIFAK